jgi:hypothetical protein
MHEDLTSYDCIVFIITVYPHNIYYKIINIIKIKIWFQLQFTYPIILSLKMIERERATVYSIPIWLFIYLYTNYLHCFSIILYTSYTCSLSLGQREKCTVYVCTLLCTLLCTVQFAGLTSPQLHLQHWTFLSQKLINSDHLLQHIHKPLYIANWWTTSSVWGHHSGFLYRNH